MTSAGFRVPALRAGLANWPEAGHFSAEKVERDRAGFGDSLDVMVPKLSHLNLWYHHFRDMHRDGRELWFYTCCHPVGRYPNRFLDQPLVKTRVLHWIGYLYGLDGYLHWGLNYFAPGVDPYSEEGISKDLPLGDRAIMYPGKDGPVGKIKRSDIEKIAQVKLADLNTRSVESAMRTIEGSARSMGLEVVEG